jgi:hypothetical protein
LATPWWMYPADSPGGGYQEITDPFGNYLKPDTNIAVPSGTPITALLPGKVTDVSSRGPGDGGLSVTVDVGNAINSIARYVSYNFLGSTNVTVGQSIASGQQIGTAGSSTGVDFALALGVSPSWGTQCPQCSSKQPLLDPRQLLNAAKSGTLGSLATITGNPNITVSTGGGNTSPTACDPWDIPCILSQLVTSDLFQRGGIIFIGLLLVLIGLVVVLVGEGAKHPEAAGNIAKVAAL